MHLLPRCRLSRCAYRSRNQTRAVSKRDYHDLPHSRRAALSKCRRFAKINRSTPPTVTGATVGGVERFPDSLLLTTLLGPAASHFQRFSGFQETREAGKQRGPSAGNRLDELRVGFIHFVDDSELDGVALLFEFVRPKAIISILHQGNALSSRIATQL